MELVKGIKTYIIEPYTILNYDCKKHDGSAPKLLIGKYTSIAINCTFISCNHRTDTFTSSPGIGYSKGDIIIGNDVWIGANVTILDNVTIGDGAVIAAGSIVTHNIEPYSIVGGNPAKLIKYRFSEEIRNRLEKLNFWNFDDSLIETFDIHTTNIEEFIDTVTKYIDNR
jgi:acetyltransferase-like isoleucine patch superfamily enzyme